MTNKIRILILTAPYGNGHYSVSNSIIEVIKKRSDIEYIIYDIYTEDFPIITKIVNKFYMSTYKKGLSQQAYRFFYYGSDKLLNLKIAKPYVNFGFRKMIKKIKEVQPDMILNTFPVNCTYNLKSEGIDIPVYTVITDYFANSNWISKEIRLHFLATENVSNQLKIRGVEEEQYRITGIPIKPIYYEDINEEQIKNLKEKFNIENGKKVVLLVAGAHGVVPNVSKIVSYITNEDNIELLVVCGKNARLYKKLKRKFSKQKNLQIFEFVYNLHELMHISDLMITKPGGITMTEAANIGIPVVLYRPVYGQELENAIYFNSMRAATIALQEDELIYKTLTILNDDELLNDMKRNIKKIAIKNSAELITNYLLEDYQKFIEEKNENHQN